MRRRLPLIKQNLTQTKMRRLLLAITLLSALTLQAKKWTPAEVKDMIGR